MDNLKKVQEASPAVATPSQTASETTNHSSPHDDRKTKCARLFSEVKIPPMRPTVRKLLGIILLIIGIYYLFNALAVGLSSVTVLLAGLNGLATTPWLSLATMLIFLFSLVAFVILGLLAISFAFSFFRNAPFKRNLIILALITLILEIVVRYCILPILGNQLIK